VHDNFFTRGWNSIYAIRVGLSPRNGFASGSRAIDDESAAVRHAAPPDRVRRRAGSGRFLKNNSQAHSPQVTEEN
jgi:hypothetical protein